MSAGLCERRYGLGLGAMYGDDETDPLRRFVMVMPRTAFHKSGELKQGNTHVSVYKEMCREQCRDDLPRAPPVYEPSTPKRNLKMPTDPTSSDIAAAMLKLLQDQTYTRQARKQRLYQSWFQ